MMKRRTTALLIFVFLAAAIGVRAQENSLPEAYTGVAQAPVEVSAANPYNSIFESRSTPRLRMFRSLPSWSKTRAPTHSGAHWRRKIRGASPLSAPLAIRSRSPANAYKVLTLSSPSLPHATCLSSSSITTDGPPITPSVTYS